MKKKKRSKHSSPKQLQESIELGAVTKEYKADAKQVIKELNELRSTEIASYLQYKQHAYMAVSLFSPGFKAEFNAHANQELEHADLLAERIQQIGGVPIFDPEEIAEKARQAGVEPRQGSTMAEMIGQDLTLERQQIERYSVLARKIQATDPVTWLLVVQILAQTEKHAAELADFLSRKADVR
ncbi:MAG: ferritin-like domain-containing protein [Nitrospirales bacterium]